MAGPTRAAIAAAPRPHLLVRLLELSNERQRNVFGFVLLAARPSTHPNLIFYRRIGASGFPRHGRPHPEASSLEVHKEVSLRTRAGVAVAVAAGGELLRPTHYVGELVVVVDDLERVNVEPDLVEARRAIVDRLVVDAFAVLAPRDVRRALAVEQRVVLGVALAERHKLGGIVGVHVVAVNLDLASADIDFVFAIGACSLVVLNGLARA